MSGGVFYHRSQDNLAPIFVSGRISEGLVARGVTPLFDESVMELNCMKVKTPEE
jgi:hypothetical protein